MASDRFEPAAFYRFAVLSPSAVLSLRRFVLRRSSVTIASAVERRESGADFLADVRRSEAQINPDWQ